MQKNLKGTLTTLGPILILRFDITYFRANVRYLNETLASSPPPSSLESSGENQETSSSDEDSDSNSDEE